MSIHFSKASCIIGMFAKSFWKITRKKAVGTEKAGEIMQIMAARRPVKLFIFTQRWSCFFSLSLFLSLSFFGWLYWSSSVEMKKKRRKLMFGFLSFRTEAFFLCKYFDKNGVFAKRKMWFSREERAWYFFLKWIMILAKVPHRNATARNQKWSSSSATRWNE